jgi:hypothetical protein
MSGGRIYKGRESDYPPRAADWHKSGAGYRLLIITLFSIVTVIQGGACLPAGEERIGEVFQVSVVSYQFELEKEYAVSRNFGFWQKAHRLTISTYRLLLPSTRNELCGLTSQMPICVSIPANIAEGCGSCS